MILVVIYRIDPEKSTNNKITCWEWVSYKDTHIQVYGYIKRVEPNLLSFFVPIRYALKSGSATLFFCAYVKVCYIPSAQKSALAHPSISLFLYL